MTRSEAHRGDDVRTAAARRRKRAALLAAALTVVAMQRALAADGSAASEAPLAASGSQLEFTLFQDKLFVAARSSASPIALYFEAEWCAPCRKMHEQSFRDPAVLEAASGVRLFRVDMTTPSHELAVLQKSFGVLGAPTLIVFGPDAKERKRRVGFIAPGDLAAMLRDAAAPAGGN